MYLKWCLTNLAMAISLVCTWFHGEGGGKEKGGKEGGKRGKGKRGEGKEGGGLLVDYSLLKGCEVKITIVATINMGY